MLEDLKFVSGAVARKDFLPELTHFHISRGRITGYNGTMAISSPIPLDMNCSPKAAPFTKAIQACPGEVTKLSLTPGGKISVRAGSFRATIDCLSDPCPVPASLEGERIELAETFLPALRLLRPFIAEDASRGWSKGILMRRGCLYATNNVVLIQKWLDLPPCPDINLPEMVINELLRMREPPTYMRVTESCVTFFFANERWLWSTLYSTQWPEVDPIVALPHDAPVPVDDALRAALLTLKPFVETDSRIFFKDDGITTTNNVDDGAEFAMAHTYGNGVFNHRQLSLVCDVASTLDISQYPKPATFRGAGFRGVLAGMAQA